MIQRSEGINSQAGVCMLFQRSMRQVDRGEWRTESWVYCTNSRSDVPELICDSAMIVQVQDSRSQRILTFA